jgi:transposase
MHDNLKTAVLERLPGYAPVFNPRYLDFAAHYGFKPVACNVGRGNEIAAELATKLKFGLETRPPEEQIAAAKAWLAERRAMLVLDDIWENDVTGKRASWMRRCTPVLIEG